MKSAKKIAALGLASALAVAVAGSWVANRILLREGEPAPRFAGTILSEPSDAILKRACFDCHSNETRWPWYSYLPPVSSLIVWDVADARSHVNFSRWDQLAVDKQGKLARKMIEEVTDDSMPLPRYLWLHQDAVVTDAELTQLKSDVLAKYGEGPVHDHEDDED